MLGLREHLHGRVNFFLFTIRRFPIILHSLFELIQLLILCLDEFFLLFDFLDGSLEVSLNLV